MKQILLKDLRSDDEDTLGEALQQLYLMIIIKDEEKANVKAQKEFFELGGHATVVWVMNENKHKKDIQHNGIFMLMNAFHNNNKLMKLIADVGDMETIIEAMKKFEFDKEIQRDALQVLENLFWTENGKVHTDNAKLFVEELKAFPLILDVLKKFSDQEDVVLNACEVVNSLCDVKELREQIFDANAFSVLANAMDNHKDNEKIRVAVNSITEAFLEYSKSIG